MTSFEIFIDTIEKLAGSQRYYTRVYNMYLNMTDTEKLI